MTPEGLNKAAAAKVAASLVSRKLMREVRSKPDMPVWREDEEGRGTSLVITREGREAIGLQDGENDSSNLSLAAEGSTLVRRQRSFQKRLNRIDEPRPGSKQAVIVTMLSRKSGATLEALVGATGWLPHTTRVYEGRSAPRRVSRHNQDPSPLTGLLFDADGERLTPSHALKKGVRYRYYVSRHLITGDKTKRRGMRLPASGIETLIRTRIEALLGSPEELTSISSAPGDCKPSAFCGRRPYWPRAAHETIAPIPRKPRLTRSLRYCAQHQHRQSPGKAGKIPLPPG